MPMLFSRERSRHASAMPGAKKTGDSEVGARIRGQRESLGMSQDELARRVGLRSQGSISALESGSVAWDHETLPRVARALGTSQAYLLEGPGIDMANEFKRTAEVLALALGKKGLRKAGAAERSALEAAMKTAAAAFNAALPDPPKKRRGPRTIKK